MSQVSFDWSLTDQSLIVTHAKGALAHIQSGFNLDIKFINFYRIFAEESSSL